MVYIVKLNQEFSFLCLLMPYSTKQNRFNVFSDCIFYNARRGRNYASAGIWSQALTTSSKWGFSMTDNSLGAVTLDLSPKLPLGTWGNGWVRFGFDHFCVFTHRASIVWNCLPSQLKSKPSYSSFKANIKKFSDCIDQIPFSTNSTATNNNSDEFIYYWYLVYY